MSEPLLFDMDGVLLVGPGTDPGVYRMAAHDALRELGVEGGSRSELATLGAVRYAPEMAAVCERHGVDPEVWWAARERHASRRTNARVRSGERTPYADADALADLATDRRLGLVSNNRHATASFVAEFCYPGVFRTVVGRDPTIDDYRRRKPEPDLLERGLTDLGVDSGLYVGDRETDVIAAHRAGLDAVFVRRPHNDAGTLSVRPAHVVDSLTDLRDRLDGA